MLATLTSSETQREEDCNGTPELEVIALQLLSEQIPGLGVACLIKFLVQACTCA